MVESEERTYTINAPREVLERFERFMTILNFSGNAGHSGTFAMAFDGDGSEFFNTDFDNRDDYINGAMKISGVGYHVEIATRNGFTGRDLDFEKDPKWNYDDGGKQVEHGDVIYARRKFDPLVSQG